jgi:hypothetical protein
MKIEQPAPIVNGVAPVPRVKVSCLGSPSLWPVTVSLTTSVAATVKSTSGPVCWKRAADAGAASSSVARRVIISGRMAWRDGPAHLAIPLGQSSRLRAFRIASSRAFASGSPSSGK